MKNFLVVGLIFFSTLFGIPYMWQNVGQKPQPSYTQESYTLYFHESGEKLELSVVDYLIGCLFAQIPMSYHEEALRAQAVAAHTYAERYILNTSKSFAAVSEIDGADLTTDGTVFQPFFTEKQARELYKQDYDEYYQKAKKAAEYGAGYIILYENEPIYAVYHLLCAGFTNSADKVWGIELPYLQSVNSTWDNTHQNFECTNELIPDDLRRRVIEYDKMIKTPTDYTSWFQNSKADQNGYVTSVEFGDTRLSGGDAWRIFNLRSTAFEVSYNGDVFSVATKGHGHGVGLSQYGADYMAKRGYTAQEILEYYYTGVQMGAV